MALCRLHHVGLLRPNHSKPQITGISLVLYHLAAPPSETSTLFVRFAPNWIRWMLKKKSFVADLLNLKFKKTGYVFDSSVILHDICEEEKGRLVWMHSERLALAFGLVKIPNGRPIRIIKNLRFCLDCHATFKLVSKLVQREIVIRDMNRFHHFDDGNCSCSDYW